MPPGWTALEAAAAHALVSLALNGLRVSGLDRLRRR